MYSGVDQTHHGDVWFTKQQKSVSGKHLVDKQKIKIKEKF